MSYGYYRSYRRVEPMNKITDPAVLERIAAVINNNDVPQNTKDFMQSLQSAFEKWNGLTERQFEAFEKVEKRFSPENIAERKAWSVGYTDERREIAKICANYYLANPPYFGDLARRVVNEPEFVPTERQYRALCENKYAKKVVAATIGDCLFAEGSMVKGRATASLAIRNKLLLVIETDAAPVTNAAKGSKKYRVLPVGEPNTILVEERELKKAPKRKK